MPTQRFSKTISDKTNNLWVWYCVLPQVALWGKGKLYAEGTLLIHLSANSAMRGQETHKLGVVGLSCGFEEFLIRTKNNKFYEIQKNMGSYKNNPSSTEIY